MKITARELNQNGKKYYLASITIGELVDVELKTAAYSSKDNTGYQRLPSPSKVNEFATFIQKAKGTCPLSVLVSIRDKVTPVKKVTGIVDLIFPTDIKPTLWVVDGQHRLCGFQKLMGLPELESFSIPLVILPAWESEEYERDLEEAKEFLIINKTQKGIRPDLAERLISELSFSEKEEYLRHFPRSIRNSLEWTPRAIDITEKLNEVDGVWHKKIRFPNDPKLDTLVSQKAFTDSLQPVITNTNMKAFDSEQTAKILSVYWDAIASLMPEAFEDAKAHVAQKTTGVFVFHSIFPKVISYVKKDEHFTKELVSGLLKNLKKKINSEYWRNDGPAGQYGTSRKAFGLIRALLEKELDEAAKGGKEVTTPFKI